MNGAYLRTKARAIVAVLATVFSPLPAWAYAPDAALPPAQLQAPSRLAANQPFVVKLLPPAGPTDAWSFELSFMHCAVAPTRTGGLADAIPTFGRDCVQSDALNREGRFNARAPTPLDLKGLTAGLTLMYNNRISKQQTFEQWLQGVWYVRARFITSNWDTGPWGNYQRTVIGALQAPTILAPTDNHLYVNGDGTLQLRSNLDHASVNGWAYEFQSQQRMYYTQANTTVAGSQGRSVGPAGPWQDKPIIPTTFRIQESTGTQTISLPFTALTSGQPNYSFQYRFRVREHYTGTSTYTAWTSWRSFIMQEPIAQLKSLPPKIYQPAQGAVFLSGAKSADGQIPALVTVPMHVDEGSWGCCWIQWQRAQIVTTQNWDYIHAHPGTVAVTKFRRDWPDGHGLLDEPEETSATTEEGVGSTFTGGWQYDELRPHNGAFGYQYWFRVREIKQTGSYVALGPWSDWRSFIVQEPVEYALPLGFPSGVITQSKQVGSQPPSQHAIPPGALTSRAPLRRGFVLKAGGAAGHALPRRTATVSARRYAGGAEPLRPQLLFTHEIATVDTGCRDLRKLLTIRETIHNDGRSLAAGHARLYVKEAGGARIAAPSVALPAMAHGASATVTLTAGTLEAHRANTPGIHHLTVTLVVDGRPTVHLVTIRMGPNTCQRHVRISPPTRLHPKAGTRRGARAMPERYRLGAPFRSGAAR